MIPSSYQKEVWSPPGCRYFPDCYGSTWPPVDAQELNRLNIHVLTKNIYKNIECEFKFSYSLGDVEDFPSLGVEWHQPGCDEVSSPWFHSTVKYLI